MKTIYKEPRTSKPETNEVQAVRKINTTGTLKEMKGTRYDLIVSYNTPIAYVVEVENEWKPKVILCNNFYSMTTRKHQAIVREIYDYCEIGEFDLGGFFKRAEIDGVDVSGGANGGYNINKTEFF